MSCLNFWFLGFIDQVGFRKYTSEGQGSGFGVDGSGPGGLSMSTPNPFKVLLTPLSYIRTRVISISSLLPDVLRPPDRGLMF